MDLPAINPILLIAAMIVAAALWHGRGGVMRWVALLFVTMSPVLASNPSGWNCRSTVSLDVTEFGQSYISFRLSLFNGRFLASTSRDSFGNSAPLSWFWMGSWIRYEDQIAMIGQARKSWGRNYGGVEYVQELQAFSTVFEDDVLILNMVHDDRLVLVRCLHEGL